MDISLLKLVMRYRRSLLDSARLVVVSSALVGCSAYQRMPAHEIPPPEHPGDPCANWTSEGRERPCPDGMKCGGARYERRKVVERAHCELLSGRCAATSDCTADEICVRNTLAIGYCAPTPGLR